MTAPIRFERLVSPPSVRACSACGALVYDRDDAEDAHRRLHAANRDAAEQLRTAADELRVVVWFEVIS